MDADLAEPPVGYEAAAAWLRAVAEEHQKDAAPAPLGTRERILEAAVEIFAERGFDGCKMSDLAAAVGIKTPGLYSHFSSKEEILAEGISRILRDFVTQVAAPNPATRAEDNLRVTVTRHVLYQLDHVTVARATDMLLNRESTEHFLPPADYEFLLKVQRSYFELVRHFVQQTLPTGAPVDASVATMAIISLCDRVTSWYDAAGRLSKHDVAEQYWQLVRAMLTFPE